MRRILCAVDYSEPSLRAARLASSLAGQCGSDLVLFNVVRLPRGRQDGIASYLRDEHSAEPPNVVVIESAQDELARLGDRLGTEGKVAVTCDVRGGDPAAEIVVAAKDHNADLLVIGHRGQSWIAKALLGSVARRVIETAPCPVLVVR